MIHTPFKEATKGMTFREKLDHFWTYYKLALGIAAGIIMVLCMIITGIVNSMTQVVYSGMAINAFLTDEGSAYLHEDLAVYLEATGRREEVILDEAYLQNMASSSNVEDKYMSAMQVTVMVAAREIDYLMMNETAYNYYQYETVFPPMQETLSAELMEQLSEYIVYYTDPVGETYPMAIDITDWAFTKDCVRGSGKIYLAFCGNTGRTATNDVFVEYLLNWK